MAKIDIIGGVTVVTSELKYEDILTVAKYRPEALILKGGDSGKEQLFRISTTSDNFGSIGKYGATFGGKTHDGNGFATITLVTGKVEDGIDVKEYVAGEIGPHVLTLSKLEPQIAEAIEDINAEKAAILENITVVG